MGFISFSMDFYSREIARLGAHPPSDAAVYCARTLLKMLDDLADDGYTALNDQLEAAGCGAAWLRGYLQLKHAEPFPRVPPLAEGDVAYAPQEIPLEDAIRQAVAEARMLPEPQGIPGLEALRRFCRWIGYEPDTAYIFLLRDTLLPFVYYQSRGCENIHPWLLSRQSLARLTGSANADDEIRAVIFQALEQGCGKDFQAFCAAVLPGIRLVMQKYSRAGRCLRDMLGSIRQKRILIIESGCTGTFPMLLMALDARADMRMYTTYPYLVHVYAGRIYTPRYEENRLLETLAAQEAYFRFARWRDGKCDVRVCADEGIKARALAELRAMTPVRQQGGQGGEFHGDTLSAAGQKQL